ncbi:MAG: DMT family transporter [Erysipelotrichaceae bacterium]|nr:DMT family transporter [Erysipelotrichaceae bacterium]
MNTYKLKYISAVIIYGTIGYILHFVNLPSEIVVLCRGVIGSLFIYLYLRVTKRNIDLVAIINNIKYLIISGVALGLNWVFLFASYRVGTVAVGSLCNYMAPIILIALSPVLFKEKITFKKLLCVIGAFIGIIFVSGILETNSNVNGYGVLLGLLAAAAFVLIIIFNRKLKNISAYDKVVVQLAISALTVLPYAIINNIGNTIVLDLKSVVLVIMLGVIHTGVAYCFYFGSINDIPVQAVAILGYIEPVLSVLSSALLLNEPISFIGIIGAILILLSACFSEIIE